MSQSSQWLLEHIVSLFNLAKSAANPFEAQLKETKKKTHSFSFVPKPKPLLEDIAHANPILAQ
jgi:hypothetical protein